MTDPEIFEQVPLLTSKCIITTTAYREPTSELIEALKRNGYGGKIFSTALTEKDYRYLKRTGADGILMTHKMAAKNFYNEYLIKEFEAHKKVDAKSEI